MRPKKIFLVRHGQSEGNVNKAIYASMPDYAVQLTEKGKIQAQTAGKRIQKIIKEETAFFYVSSFHRTRQTYKEMVKNFAPKRVKYREEPRLREQEWSGYLNDLSILMQRSKDRDAYGHFYYRFQGGESCADVYDRLSSFFSSLHRDFQKPEFPENAILVTHGMTARVFLMRWFHLTIEEFEVLSNPRNCDVIVLELQKHNKYKLVTKLKRKKTKHPYHMPI